MRDGKVVVADSAAAFDRGRLIAAMGGVAAEGPRVEAASRRSSLATRRSGFASGRIASATVRS